MQPAGFKLGKELSWILPKSLNPFFRYLRLLSTEESSDELEEASLLAEASLSLSLEEPEEPEELEEDDESEDESEDSDESDEEDEDELEESLATMGATVTIGSIKSDALTA